MRKDTKTTNYVHMLYCSIYDNLCVDTCVRMCTTFMYIYIYIHTHIYIYTYIHVCVRVPQTPSSPLKKSEKDHYLDTISNGYYGPFGSFSQFAIESHGPLSSMIYLFKRGDLQ